MSQTPEEIALERIREAAESGAETLDLKKLGLQRLPDKVGQLQICNRANRYRLARKVDPQRVANSKIGSMVMPA